MSRDNLGGSATHSTSKIEKEGEESGHSAGKASCKQLRKQKNKSSEIVNACQPHVNGHLLDSTSPVDGQHPQPSSAVHLNTDTRTSEYLDSIVRGNDKESSRVQEISINYINSGETFDRKITIVDTYFFE